MTLEDTAMVNIRGLAIELLKSSRCNRKWPEWPSPTVGGRRARCASKAWSLRIPPNETCPRGLAAKSGAVCACNLAKVVVVNSSLRDSRFTWLAIWVTEPSSSSLDGNKKAAQTRITAMSSPGGLNEDTDVIQAFANGPNLCHS